MLYQTIPEMLRATVRRYPEHVAVRNTRDQKAEPQAMTYAELDRASSDLAAGLRRLGIRPGDRVALMSPPRTRFPVSVLGILKLGGWVVPMDPSFTREEAATILAHAEAKAVLASNVLFDRLPEGIQRIDLDDEASIPFLSVLGGDEVSRPPTQPNDVAILAYTSGTTGHAKGVMLSHANILADLLHGTKIIPVLPNDVFLFIAPWHHILGLVTGLFLPFYGGATAMYTDEYRRVAELMKAHRVTIFAGVPKFYHAMYDRLIAKIRSGLLPRVLWRAAPRVLGRSIKQRLAGPQLRFFVSGSAPLAPEAAKAFRRLGIGMLEGYGLTETSPVVSLCLPYSEKTGSVGRPIPEVEAKLLDANPDGVGELLVRGPIVMQGYYKNEEATRRAIDADGWFHTGDLAALDADGEIFLRGRAKNTIVLETGKNVYPEELEWEIGRIPYVEEVLVRGAAAGAGVVVEASVYPDQEAIAAAGIVRNLKAVIWEAIVKQQQRLAPYKRIRSQEHVHLVDVPFPKTSTLDIKRHLVPPTGAPDAI